MLSSTDTRICAAAFGAVSLGSLIVSAGTGLICAIVMLPTQTAAQTKFQDIMHCLEQPLEEKRNTEWINAKKKSATCLAGNMDRLVPTTPRPKLANAVCNACDKELIAAATIYFEGKKHCTPDKQLESDLKSERRLCQLQISETAFKAKQKWEDSTAQSALFGSFGSWRVEGRTLNSGLLVYVLLSEDTDRRTSLELHCRSANLSRVAYWHGPFKKLPGSDQAVLTTYSIDGKSLKQAKAYVLDDGKLLINNHSANLETLVSALRTMKDTLYLSGQSIAAKFAAVGYLEMERDWLKRCLG